MSHHNSSSSSSSTTSSRFPSYSKKKLLHLFNLRDPAVQAEKNQFTWGSHLGSGTYGEVSRCVWKTKKPRLDVAIKVVPKHKVSSQTQQERLLTHAIKLQHPHIVSLYHWFHSRQHYYMVFELAEGGELFDHIVTHGRFNDLDARHMVSDITSAVAYIHSLNLVHRDLKPENLFVRGKAPFSPPFDLVVADFGVAVQLDSPNGQISGVCGSPGYTAPEVYRRQRYGKPVDMWSLGVITFIMLCGRFPFAHLQGPAFLAELDDPIRASSRFPKHFGLSRAAEDFIMRCLTVDPVERMTAEQAMNHEWLVGPPSPGRQSLTPSTTETDGTRCDESFKKPNKLVASEADEDVEVICFPTSSTSSPSESEDPLAPLQLCRTRTISEGPRSAM